jgi:hypothetical protein
MSRLLKAVTVALALAVLSLFAASCGSNNPAQIRFVNAIQDTAQYGTALDIEVNGTNEFTAVGFEGVQPPSGYKSVPSGGDSIKGLETATTTTVFNTNITLNAGLQYTVVATGFATSVGRVAIISAADNNTAPANGSVKFRVIHASPSGGAVDVYIAPNPPQGLGTKYFSGLTYNNPSAYTYVTIPYNSSVPNGQPNYTMFVTVAGTTTPILITQTLTAGSTSAGAIRTLVLTDQQNVDQLNQLAIVLNDLN